MSKWISLIFTSFALFSREGRKQCQSCNKRQLNDAFYYHCSYNYLYHTKIGQWDMCLGVHTIIGHWNVFFAEENSIDILFRSVKHVVTEEWYILVLSILIIDTDYRWSWTSEQEFKIGFFLLWKDYTTMVLGWLSHSETWIHIDTSRLLAMGCTTYVYGIWIGRDLSDASFTEIQGGCIFEI